MEEQHLPDRASAEAGGESRETLERPDLLSALRALELGDTEMAITFSPTPADGE